MKISTLALSLSLSLISFKVYSQQLPPEAKIEVFSDFSGGLNTSIVPSKLKHNFSPNLSNILIDEEVGRLKKFKGFVIAGYVPGLTQNKVAFLGLLNISGSPKEYVISDSSVVVTTKDFMTHKTIMTGLNTNFLLQYTQVRNKLWFTNGNDKVFTYDGSTVNVLDGGTYSGTILPNVPRGKFILFAQERVWIFNSTASASALNFSALTSTDATIIAPDDYRAWPLVNQLNIAQGDGTSGTGLWLYKGQVQAGKDKSIHTIFGIDTTDFTARKTSAKVGPSSQDSIKILDNLTYFKGMNGIYTFDGINTDRISDNMLAEIEAVQSNENRSILNIWDSQADFLRGVNFTGTTVTATGSLYPACTNQLTLSTAAESASQITNAKYSLAEEANENAHYSTYTTVNMVPENFYGHINAITTWSQEFPGAGNFRVYLKNNRTGLKINNAASNNLIMTRDETVFADYLSLFFTGADINKSSVSVSYTIQGGLIDVHSASVTFAVGLTAVPELNTQFISDIATVTTITSWGNFNATTILNGGSVKFFIRSATSVVNISTETWTPIVPGNGIGFSSSKNFIQWAATMTASAIGSPVQIDYVSIAHNEGGVLDSRPIAESWQNRYWVFVSTLTTGNTTIGYVKSKITNSNPNAWMPLNGINIKSILNSDDVFYAGSSTAPIVFRLDYGTDFNGSPIVGVYDTPDIVFDNFFFKKDLMKFLIDIEKESGATLKIATSYNGGDFTEQSVSIDGTGRLLTNLNAVNKNGYYFRFRIKNDDLDKDLRLNNFGVVYKNSERGN